MGTLIRVISVLATVASITALADAQDIWDKQSPFPTDRVLNGIHALSAQQAFICGGNRHLMETRDGGATWLTHISSGYGYDPFYAVYFRDTSVGLVVGNNNDAWRTANGAASWSQITSVEAGSWYHIDFVSPTNGFIGANGAAMASTDGGATWSLRSFYPNCPVMYGMDFRDDNVGLAGGWQPSSQELGIWKTTDGGRTWTRKFTSSANAVLWMSATRAIADNGAFILQTLDTGETWSPIGLVGSGVTNLARAGTTNVVCGVSEKGDVWRSPDGGFTWVQVFDGPGALPVEWDIHFADSQNGWFVGDAGFVYATRDGGLTWRQVNNGCGAQISDIHMLTPDFGMAVGHNGYIFRTLNGGAFWDVQKLEVTGQIWGRDEDLVAIDVVDSQFAVAAGPGGTVFKTTNGGESWTSIGYPNLSGVYWIYDVDFIDHNLGYLYGVDDNPPHTRTLFRTRDGGATWEWVNLGERGGGTTAQFVDSQYGWLTADNRFGLRTIDGGATWTEFWLPDYFTTPEVSKVRFLDRNVGWAVGWSGYVAKTSNGGATWNLVDIGTIDEHLFDVVPVSATEVWACGRLNLPSDGVVYHTVNGGQTWTRQVVQSAPSNPYRVWALPTGNAWFGGFGGTIYRRRVGDQTVLPFSFTIAVGRLVSGSLASLFSSDNAYVVAAQSTNGDFVEPIQIVVQGTSTVASPASLKFLTESHTDGEGVQQKASLWNWQTNRWEDLGTNWVRRTDQTQTLSVTGTPSRFVQPGTRLMKARIRFAQVSADTLAQWKIWSDRYVWQVRP